MFRLEIDNKKIAFGFEYIRDVNFEVRPSKIVTDVTQCKLSVNDEIYTGTACCVKGDAFRKETGRKNALARALKSTDLSKREKTLIWSAYFARVK